jgi:hypothetical protein
MGAEQQINVTIVVTTYDNYASPMAHLVFNKYNFSDESVVSQQVDWAVNTCNIS